MYIYQPGLPGQRTSSPEDTHTAYLRTERAHGRKTNKQAPIRSCRLVHQLLKRWMPTCHGQDRHKKEKWKPASCQSRVCFHFLDADDTESADF